MDSPIEEERTYTGNIQLILGPMFAGKSSELIRRVNRYQIAQKNCLLIKYIRDTRYDETCVATHDKYIKRDIDTVAANRLSDFQETIRDYDVIGIDEGQFFEDLATFSEAAANSGKIVIISALDGDFLRKPFGCVCDLIAMAEHVIKLKAVCMMCQRDAAFSRRLTNEDKREVIGGADKYIAVCRRCYNAEVNVTPQKKKRSVGTMSHVSPQGIRFVNNSFVA